MDERDPPEVPNQADKDVQNEYPRILVGIDSPDAQRWPLISSLVAAYHAMLIAPSMHPTITKWTIYARDMLL